MGSNLLLAGKSEELNCKKLVSFVDLLFCMQVIRQRNCKTCFAVSNAGHRLEFPSSPIHPGGFTRPVFLSVVSPCFQKGPTFPLPIF